MGDLDIEDLPDPRDVAEANRLERVDVALLPGSGADLRSAAETIRSTIPALETAAEAGTQLGALLRGELWNGPAWEAFETLVARNPIHRASQSARDAMNEAAQNLESLGATHDRHQDELRYIRSRWSASAGGDILANGSLGELQSLERRVYEIHDMHTSAEAAVADTFDRLDDATTFATPPPSTFEQIRGGAGSLGGGMVDWVKDTAPVLYVLTNPVLAGAALPYFAVAKRDEIVDTVDYATENPWDFALEFGKAFFDVETWKEDKWRWVGTQVPEIGLTVATWGTGAAAKGGLRGVDAVDDVSDAARAANRAEDAASGAARAARIPDDVKDAIAELDAALDDVTKAESALEAGSSRSGDDDDC